MATTPTTEKPRWEHMPAVCNSVRYDEERRRLIVPRFLGCKVIARLTPTEHQKLLGGTLRRVWGVQDRQDNRYIVILTTERLMVWPIALAEPIFEDRLRELGGTDEATPDDFRIHGYRSWFDPSEFPDQRHRSTHSKAH